MARITQQSSIHTTGVSYENEPIIKSDGSGEIMQWQPSDGGADGIYIVEGGSAGDPARLGIGVAAPTEALDVSGNVSIGGGQLSIKSDSSNDTPGRLNLWATDTSIDANDTIGAIHAQGTDTVTSPPKDGAKIEFNADFDWGGSTNYQSARIDFFTQDNSGTNTLTSPRLTIDSNGNVLIGAGTPASLVSGGDSPVLSIGGRGALGNGDKAGAISFITSDSSYTGTYSDGICGEIASIAETATGAAYGLAFYTATTTSSNRAERLRISSTGAVTISSGTLTVGSLDIGHGLGGAISSTAVGTNALVASLSTSTRNTAIGYDALNDLNHADADRNTAVGAYAGDSITEGASNTAVGDSALSSITTTDFNTAIGSNALLSYTGSDATAVGSGAADAATSAQNLTAVGMNALGTVTDGHRCTAVGTAALGGADTGNDNTAVGRDAGFKITGLRNSFLGSSAGTYCSSVDDSVAIGFNALKGASDAAVTGDYNIAIGSYALEDTTTGYSNVAVGHGAGRDINAGYHNVVIGFNAADDLESGDQNVAIGSYALNAEDAANSCVAVGYQALQGQNGNVHNTGVGFQSLFGNKSGTGNTALGYSAGYANVDGYNTWVGHDSGRYTGHAAANTTLGYRTYKSGSFFDGTCDLNGTTTITCDASADIAVGQSVHASGIPYGAYITAVNVAGAVTSFTINEAATTTAANQTLTFFTGTGDSNTCIGYLAGEDLTTGHSNVLVGRDAGKEFTSNFGNIAIGNNAMDSANGGENYNVAIGYNALSTETSGADYCVAIGYEALGSQNDNVKNTAIGGLAGDAITSGDANTFVGYTAGSAVTSGNHNTALGHQAYAAGTGGQNTIIGSLAGDAAMTSSNNVCVGYAAGSALSSGPGNVLIGHSAGVAMTSGDYNIAIGFQAADAMTGESNYNIAIGPNALGAEASGADSCIAIGRNALNVQNDGSAINMAIGENAGDAITSGTKNVLIGHESGSAITTADNNTALGYNALKLATGNANTAIGRNAIDAACTGGFNVAVGDGAMGDSAASTSGNVSIGVNSLATLNHNDGDYNIAVGMDAGRYHETTASATPGSATPDGNNSQGYNSIFIGYDTRSSSVGGVNEIVIGHTAVSNGDNTITLGNDDTGAIHCADGSISALSDRRIKRDITDNNVGLDFVEKLTTVNYKRLNPADWPAEIRSHRYRVEEHQELVTPAVEAAEAVYEDVIIQEASAAVEEVTETIEHPAVEAVYEDVIIPAVEEIRDERHKHTETEVTETVTREEIVEIDGKWVKREVSEEVTRTERTPVYEECDLYNEDGTQCMCCVTEARDAVTEERQVVDENGDGVVDEDGNPVMETVEIEPAVEAVHEPMKHKVPVMEEYVVQAAQEERTERKLVSPAIPARTEVRVITPAEPAVEEIKERRLVKEAVEAQEAVYKTVTKSADERPADDDTVRLGLIAQDVQTAMTEAGVEFDLVTTGANGKLAVKYSNLVIPLLKAVQELSAEVKALKG